MKLAGCLKLEVIKPVNHTWDEVGPRMRVLSRALAPALSATQRDLWPDLHTALEAIRTKDPDAGELMYKARDLPIVGRIRENWNREILRIRAFHATQTQSTAPARRGQIRRGVYQPYPERVYEPVSSTLANASRDYIKSRWSGDHLKDLLANRSSIPSWVNPCAFYADGDDCRASGDADHARLTFPLWGSGSKATEFVVAPCGAGHRALWDRMTGGAEGNTSIREQRVSLERSMREARKQKSPQLASFKLQLEKLSAIKMGKVGLKYDDRKRKWYALVTWTQMRPDTPAAGNLSAVCNFGVNCFIMVVAEGGKLLHRESGQAILAVRKRFSHRRRRIQETLNMMGSGSKGRGVKRRMRPITDLDDKEQRFCDTVSKQIASVIAKKCREHGIGTLYMEDLSGVRESFEKETGGDAHPSVKRYIHTWGYFKFQQHLERACEVVGTQVKMKDSYYVSQDCPFDGCGHSSPDNVKIRQGNRTGSIVMHHGRPHYEFEEPRTIFDCVACERKADGDMVACVNHLKHLGLKASIDHTQSEAWKQTNSLIEKGMENDKSESANAE